MGEPRPTTGVPPLAPDRLCRLCDAGAFPFATTEELEDLTEIVGQDRAVAAIEFAVGMRRGGYNAFLLGPAGSGRHVVARRLLQRRAQSEPAPGDWCYVFNFEHSHQPRALHLPAGAGRRLERAIRKLVHDLKTVIPAVFESDDYRRRRSGIEEAVKKRHQEALARVQEDAKARDLALMQTDSGIAIAPLSDGQAMPQEAFAALPEARREVIQEDIHRLQERLGEIMQQVPGWAREARETLERLDREIAGIAARSVIGDARAGFADLPQVLDFLDAVEADVVEHVALFRRADDAPGQIGPYPHPGPAHARPGAANPTLSRYAVNVLVDCAGLDGAPVVYADQPGYRELFGSIEHVAELGTLVTDFTRIKAGALHRANGGYLILDARKVLMEPFVWEGLKHALRSREIRIEAPQQAAGVVSTQTLSPAPIPLDLKVVLIGDRALYYRLDQSDPDFAELFKVTADLDDHLPRSDDNNMIYARLLATMARAEALRPLTCEAVARLLDHSSRLAGDAERLSTQFRRLSDLAREADYYAGGSGRDRIEREDVERAIEGAVERVSRMRLEMQEQILRGSVLIDTDGEAVGQINGLSVLHLGRYAFGKPARITARLRIGAGRVVDIEREVELGGPLHSKGVMILASYLGAHYAPDQPLALSASLVFEQSYGGVDGDSASSTELYALLSALSGLPIRQSLAVTGAVNQHGRVQAIGGVNEKIEGFFDICRARGLTGGQGVLIPESNVKNLMLRADVVEAVRGGGFRIHEVKTIDEGIELLTGVEAGSRGADGLFPEGTINRLVEERLIEFAEKRRRFAGDLKEAEAGAGAGS